MLNFDSDESSALHDYIETTNEFYHHLLGYILEQTSLQQVKESQWDEFAQTRGLNPNSSGIYLPRNQTAVIQEQNPLSLFHEYFGHGLYCEQNLTGRKLVELEKRLLDEEIREFNGKQFSLDDLQKFRQENQTFRELENFKEQNLSEYELFAIWTEYLLSNEHNLREEFEIKYDSLKNRYKEAVDSVIEFSNQYGNLATMYAQGMARNVTTDRVRKLLREVHGENKINNSRLILLSGSRNPFSDIDLFASSDYLLPIKNDWLDLVVFHEEDFERRVRLFETQVTHPIIAGEFIAGDKDYLIQKRAQLQEQPITEEAIQHNLRKSEEQDKFASNELNIKQREVHKSYSKTYLANALALKEGKRIFTKEELTSYLHSKNIEGLKGGEKDAIRTTAL